MSRVQIAFTDCAPQTVELSSAYAADRFAKFMAREYGCPVTVEDTCDSCGEWADADDIAEHWVSKTRLEYWCADCRPEPELAPSRDCLAPLSDAGHRSCSCGAHR